MRKRYSAKDLHQIAVLSGVAVVCGVYVTAAMVAVAGGWPAADQAVITRPDHGIILATVNDGDGDSVADSADLCAGAIAGATNVDATGCPTEFDPMVGMSFDHDKHAAWYRHFWNGDCEGLSFWADLCVSGKPYWQLIDDALADENPDQASRLRNRLWSLGRLIGHEWARDNCIRTFDTDDLSDWRTFLLESPHLDAAIHRVRAASETCMIQNQPGTPCNEAP